jgi:hypothetical protein
VPATVGAGRDCSRAAPGFHASSMGATMVAKAAAPAQEPATLDAFRAAAMGALDKIEALVGFGVIRHGIGEEALRAVLANVRGKTDRDRAVSEGRLKNAWREQQHADLDALGAQIDAGMARFGHLLVRGAPYSLGSQQHTTASAALRECCRRRAWQGLDVANLRREVAAEIDRAPRPTPTAREIAAEMIAMGLQQKANKPRTIIDRKTDPTCEAIAKELRLGDKSYTDLSTLCHSDRHEQDGVCGSNTLKKALKLMQESPALIAKTGISKRSPYRLTAEGRATYFSVATRPR